MKQFEIETYGCAANQADSEYMAGLLTEEGYVIGKDSGTIIINTCTVKTPTENKIIKRLKALEKTGRKVLVTGCLPAAEPSMAERFPQFSFIGVNIADVIPALESISMGVRYVKIGHNEEIARDYPKDRINSLVEIIPISHGCLGNCSYCKVKSARGNLRSIPAASIMRYAKRAVDEGAVEIWLTSQDTGAYGMDIGTNLPDLLKQLTIIPKDRMIRVGMMNPNLVKGFLNELIEALSDERIYRFIHIPVQSGDDGVLETMNRRYSVSDYEKIVSTLRKKVPDITISTDLIAGFPTENEEAFENTLKLLERTRPDVLNISRYWARPGTPATKMKQHPGCVTKDRSRKLVKAFKEYALEKNKEWVGWEGKALVSGTGKSGDYCARNISYKPIIIKSEKDILGKWVNVRITKATYYDFCGVMI